MVMREILLTKGAIALVDDVDYDLIAAFEWHLHSAGYAARKIGRGRAQTTVLMHRFIMGPLLSQQVDHKNLNGLDNRRANLRICTHAQNMANRDKLSRRRYKGVTWRRDFARVHARIAGRHLGSFDTEVEAARAYDIAAVLLWGEFARLNFPKKTA